MPDRTETVIQDARPLYAAAEALLGYFLSNWYGQFLGVALGNMQRWWDRGLLEQDGQPNALFRRALFDFNALDLEKLAYICGIYFYVLSGHKKANLHLMRNEPKKRVLYLRGFDYEAAVSAGHGVGVGVSTVDTFQFNGTLGRHLAADFAVFKSLSPRDLYWETIGPQRYFYGDYVKIVHAASTPIRSFYLHEHHWQDDVAQLAERMDYFVAYVSSITPSVIWELNHLQETGCADRTTVVFDRPAILNKALHSGIHESLPRLAHGDVLWQPSKKRSTEEDVDALRAELEKAFTVVLADDFEAEVPALKARILAASSAMPPGARETHLEFRFHPALDDAALEYLRQVDAALWREIDPEGTQEIECLPYRLNQVHLRIFTSLLFGAHDEAGQTLAVYAGIMAGALDFYTRAGQIDENVSAEEFPKYLAVLKDHRDTAASIAWSFLSVGKSHEFGDYRKLATATYDRLFAASRDRAGRFMRGDGTG